MTWEQWIARHARLFGMITPEEVAMIGEWSRLFAGMGFTPGEANDASTDLASSGRPQYRSEHVGAIQSRVRAARSNAPRRDEPQKWDCALCDGSGWVTVPNHPPPKGYEDRAHYLTCAVACRCPVGRMRSGCKNGKGEGVMTFDSYEARVPDWRELLVAHRDQRMAERVASIRAERMDREFGPLLARLQERQAK